MNSDNTFQNFIWKKKMLKTFVLFSFQLTLFLLVTYNPITKKQKTQKFVFGKWLKCEKVDERLLEWFPRWDVVWGGGLPQRTVLSSADFLIFNVDVWIRDPQSLFTSFWCCRASSPNIVPQLSCGVWGGGEAASCAGLLLLLLCICSLIHASCDGTGVTGISQDAWL